MIRGLVPELQWPRFLFYGRSPLRKVQNLAPNLLVGFSANHDLDAQQLQEASQQTFKPERDEIRIPVGELQIDGQTSKSASP